MTMAPASGAVRRVATTVQWIAAIALALIGIWIAGFGSFDETLLRVGTYALAAFLATLTAALVRFEGARRMRWLWILDALLLAGLAISIHRYFQIGEALEIGLYFF